MVGRSQSSSTSVAIVLECFSAVERRDDARQRELFHPAIEVHWPPLLARDARQTGAARWTFEGAWDPFQPTKAERRMDPRVVAASESEVAVLWQQRGIDAGGDRLETPVLGLYEVRDQWLVRAQMFYFDPGAAAEFLGREPPRHAQVT
jgi:ketosteroid isomerase-like protein